MRGILIVLLTFTLHTTFAQGGGLTCKNCPSSPAVLSAANGLTDVAQQIQLGGTTFKSTAVKDSTGSGGGVFWGTVLGKSPIPDFTGANGVTFVDAATHSFSGFIAGNLLVSAHGFGGDDINYQTFEAAGTSGIWGQYSQLHLTDNDFVPSSATYSSAIRGEPTQVFMEYKWRTGLSRQHLWHMDSTGVGFKTEGGTDLFFISRAGAVTIKDGTQGTGKVLTSNSTGVSTWQTPNYFDTTACQRKLRVDSVVACSPLVLDGTTVSTTSNLSVNGTVTATFTGSDLSGTVSNSITVAKLNGQLPSYYLARANATGTQLASTISDFSTAVNTQLGALNTYTTPTLAQVALGSGKPYILNTTIGVVNVLLLSITP